MTASDARPILAAVVLALALPSLPAAAAEARRPPNVVFILMDDMGWRDVGFMGNSFVDTPHLDRLAKRGLVFTQAYASAPNCAPTRACLMSGQTTPRHGIYTVVDPRPATAATIPPRRPRSRRSIATSAGSSSGSRSSASPPTRS